MYCRNCGQEMDPNAAVCVHCGFKKGQGTAYCSNCGAQTQQGATFCPNCGASLAQYTPDQQKSKMTAGLLGVLLGGLGVHNFYLGYNTKAIIQLLLGTVGVLLCGLGPMVSALWGFIEGILILCGSTITTDAQGNPLKDS